MDFIGVLIMLGFAVAIVVIFAALMKTASQEENSQECSEEINE